jgi:hypothetical protein
MGHPAGPPGEGVTPVGEGRPESQRVPVPTESAMEAARSAFLEHAHHGVWDLGSALDAAIRAAYAVDVSEAERSLDECADFLEGSILRVFRKAGERARRAARALGSAPGQPQEER